LENFNRYTLFKYPPLLEFANMFNYTAMGLGNHDFDDGLPGLVPFIEQANFPVLAANIDATLEPSLVKPHFKSCNGIQKGGEVNADKNQWVMKFPFCFTKII
jgi:5'-nucleotidase